MFSLGSMVVAWTNKKQLIEALSSTKAEYKGATVATCEAMWLRQLLLDLRIQVPTLIPIYYDNIISMQLAKYLVFYAHKAHWAYTLRVSKF